MSNAYYVIEFESLYNKIKAYNLELADVILVFKFFDSVSVLDSHEASDYHDGLIIRIYERIIKKNFG